MFKDVIDNYGNQVTTNFLDRSFAETVFVHSCRHERQPSGFSYYNPLAILNHKVPFHQSVKTIANNEELHAALFSTSWACIEHPLDLITETRVYDRSSRVILISCHKST